MPESMPSDSFPSCHANGEEPKGYDGAERTCLDCVHKVTCLPAMVHDPMRWIEQGAPVWAIEDDAEVLGVMLGTMTKERFLERLASRSGVSSSTPSLKQHQSLPIARLTEHEAIRERAIKLPLPKTLTKEAMGRAMRRVQIGQQSDLCIGYQIIRRYRGQHIVVTMTPHGFLYDALLYGSLSAVAKVATNGPTRSGNEFFHLVRHRRTEIRDTDGRQVW